MLRVLCIIGCPVQLIRHVFSRLHLCRNTFASLWGDCLCVLPHFDALTHMVIRVSSAFIFQSQALFYLCCVLLFVFVKRTYSKSLLKVYYRSVFVESSNAFNTLGEILLWIKPSYFSARFVSRHCLWKTCATPGACINETGLFSSAAVVPQSKSTELCRSVTVVPHKVNLPSCVVARRLLCHEVNLPSCVARRLLCHTK